MTAAFLAGLALGAALAMWIRWDQTQTLKDENASLRRLLGSDENRPDENRRRWRGLYPNHNQQGKVR